MRLILFLATIYSINVFAEGDPDPKVEDFVQKIYVLNVGQSRISYHYSGEPVSRPAKMRIYMKCSNSGPERLVTEVPMCSWEDYHYDPSSKSVYVKYFAGRVDPETGDVNCDQNLEDRISLDVCK
jgi:hypothetical protein